MTEPLLPASVLERARAVIQSLRDAGLSLERIGKRIGMTQPALSKVVQGGGLKPRNALALFRLAKEPAPPELLAVVRAGEAFPAHEEGERLAVAVRLEHEIRHARYPNLEIHLMAHPPDTYDEDVIGAARARKWIDGDVPPWEWPVRLHRLYAVLRGADIEPSRAKRVASKVERAR